MLLDLSTYLGLSSWARLLSLMQDLTNSCLVTLPSLLTSIRWKMSSALFSGVSNWSTRAFTTQHSYYQSEFIHLLIHISPMLCSMHNMLLYFMSFVSISQLSEYMTH